MALFEKNDIKKLEHDYVQYEFMKKLKEKCPDYIENNKIYNGKNRGGASWTQFRIIRFDKVYKSSDEKENKYESVFYRIDHRKNKKIDSYYFSIEQYGRPQDDKEKKDKKDRLEKYIEIFLEILKQQKQISIKFPPEKRSHKGKYENKIAILFFNDKENTVNNILNQYPEIHKQFIKKVSESTSLTR